MPKAVKILDVERKFKINIGKKVNNCEKLEQKYK